MSGGLGTLLLFGSLILFVALGLPLVFCLGGVAVIFLLILVGPEMAVIMISLNATAKLSDFILVAIPMFIFMANMLERSGVAEDLYEMMYRWLGALRGGLAMGTVIISTILAAMMGTSGASVVTMGVVSLPSMLKRNYDKRMVAGAIMAGGALGVLIPPSVIMIVYAMAAGVSVGRMFMAGVLPGLILAALFILYIGIRCYRQADLGPSLPPEHRATWRGKLISLKYVILPLLLVVAVLGSIFLGVCTPTEASALGALGSILCAAIRRTLTWQNFKEATFRTFRLACMIMWIMVAALCFRVCYNILGANQFLQDMLLSLPMGRWGALLGMQFSFLILGCLLDPYSIVLITAPVYLPIARALGFDMVWFGILFVMNMEAAYLTPPFGFNLFYMKGVLPPDTNMGDVYRSAVPFVLLQLVGLAVVMAFPFIALWLPDVVY